MLTDGVLRKALNSRSIPSREAAYTTIVALQSSIDDSIALLRNLLPELTEAQRNLALYLINRDLAGSAGDPISGEGGGLVKEIKRMSTRL